MLVICFGGLLYELNLSSKDYDQEIKVKVCLELLLFVTTDLVLGLKFRRTSFISSLFNVHTELSI